jgi:hypothetical protein
LEQYFSSTTLAHFVPFFDFTIFHSLSHSSLAALSDSSTVAISQDTLPPPDISFFYYYQYRDKERFLKMQEYPHAGTPRFTSRNCTLFREYGVILLKAREQRGSKPSGNACETDQGFEKSMSKVKLCYYSNLVKVTHTFFVKNNFICNFNLTAYT